MMNYPTPVFAQLAWRQIFFAMDWIVPDDIIEDDIASRRRRSTMQPQPRRIRRRSSSSSSSSSGKAKSTPVTSSVRQYSSVMDGLRGSSKLSLSKSKKPSLSLSSPSVNLRRAVDTGDDLMEDDLDSSR